MGDFYQVSLGDGGQPGDAGQPGDPSQMEMEPITPLVPLEPLEPLDSLDQVANLPPMAKIWETKKTGLFYSRRESEWEQVPSPGQEQNLSLARFRKVEKSVWPFWWSRRTTELIADDQGTTSERARKIEVGLGPAM